MPVSPSLKTARSTLQAKRTVTANKLFAREIANQALTAAKRDFPADSQQVSDAQGTFLGAQGDLNTARSDETTARTNLLNEIRTWLSGTGTPPPPLTPDADFARMTKTGAPVVLFPVRLETRFGVDTSTPPKPVLRVRIYPDEFLSDMHERELLPQELQAGEDYWDQLPTDEGGNPIEDVNRWTKIAKQFGVPRAAYIVRATSFDSVLPPMRATSPSRAAEAVLPDRFVVLAFKGGDLRHMMPGKPIPEPLTFTPDPSDDAQTFMDVGDGFMVPTSVAWTVNYGEAESKGMAITIDTLAPDEVTGGSRSRDGAGPEDVGGARGRGLVHREPDQRAPLHARHRPGPARDADQQRSGSADAVHDGRAVWRRELQHRARGPERRRTVLHAGLLAAGRPVRLRPSVQRLPEHARVVLHAEGRRRRPEQRRALWGSTLGYFMSQMMNPEPFLFRRQPDRNLPAD